MNKSNYVVNNYVENIGIGNRNNYITKLLSYLIDKDIPKDIIMGTLLGANEQRCKPPLREMEVRNILKRVYKYRPNKVI